MLKHLTIQEISAKHREVYEAIVRIGRNNYHTIFFIDPETDGTPFPMIYFLNRTQLCVTSYTRGVGFIFVQDQKLLDEAIRIAHQAVESKHPYLATALEETELLLGIKQLPIALF